MTDDSEEAFLQELRATFAAEAQEHLQTLSAGLVQLEAAAGVEQRLALIETVFRGVHSLKGAARAVENRAVEALCQSMENVLSALKQGRLEFQRALADLLHEAMTALAALLAETSSDAPSKALLALCARLDGVALGQPVAEGGELPPAVAAPDKTEAAQHTDAPPDTPPAALFSPKPEAGPAPAPGAAEAHAAAAETVRIAAARLDSLVRQAEGLLSAKLGAEQRVLDIEAVAASVATLQKQRTVAPLQLRAVGQSMVAAPATPQHATGLQELAAQVEALRRAAFGDWQNLAGRVDQLLEEMKKVSMLPAATALRMFPKMVRDLARSNDKEATLQVVGGDIEVDRRILEEMRDPLIHLVRNCIDHGIEKPAERERRGKPPHGTIELSVAQRDGGRIEIVVADDGAGIDVERVRNAARQSGAGATRDIASLEVDETMDLVFQSGVSTSPLITDMSGRGLGLAIVREKVERLGGGIALHSEPGAGTRFRISLPVSLATYRGVQVRCGSRYFVFPTALVERVATVPRAAIKSVENRASVSIQGRIVAVVQLADLLGLPARIEAGDAATLVVAAIGVGSSAERRIAFLVDEVVDEQEVLVKGLGDQLQRVRNIAGAARLRNGGVALILNVVDLVRSAAQSSGRAARGALAVAANTRKSILVAEDSITSRMLLKGMLESVGYKVTAAVDGEDALARLRAESFDLVVSDVDMPRMNGLQLTAQIRADSALAALPVVLVTTLASVEDRERGAEVGASAYLVKSSFEQSNLLEVVRRLL